MKAKKAGRALGFVAGMALGYGLAMVFAPENGPGMRRRLKSVALDQLDVLLSRVESTLEKAHMDAVLEEQSKLTF